MREALEPLLLAGDVATCGIVELELLYSATSRATYRALAEALRGMPRVPIEEGDLRRAQEVQAMLAERSQHRAVSGEGRAVRIPDPRRSARAKTPPTRIAGQTQDMQGGMSPAWPECSI